MDGGECPLDLVITKPLQETKERAAVRNALDTQIRGMSAVSLSVQRDCNPKKVRACTRLLST